MLVMIAVVLLIGHDPHDGPPRLDGAAQIAVGVVAGVVVGVVAALLSVVGDELLIPTLVLLLGCDITLAGSLSRAVRLTTMLAGLRRYSRDSSFAALRRNKAFVLTMAAGSIVGTFIGAQLPRRRSERGAATAVGDHLASECDQGLASSVVRPLEGWIWQSLAQQEGLRRRRHRLRGCFSFEISNTAEAQFWILASRHYRVASTRHAPASLDVDKVSPTQARSSLRGTSRIRKIWLARHVAR